LRAAAAAAALLKKGSVVICPTDTVYGFLADATNERAVDAIYKIKKRPRKKPLSLFVRNIAMAEEMAIINKQQRKMLKKFWPGEYTFILKRKPGIVLYGLDERTVAIRIPRYPFLSNLLKKIDRPLVQTSSNVSGQPPLQNIKDIIKIFSKETSIKAIIDGGDMKKGVPSKIINITSKLQKKIR